MLGWLSYERSDAKPKTGTMSMRSADCLSTSNGYGSRRLTLARARCASATSFEDPRQPRFLGASDSRERLKPLIRAFVTLGIHPVHPAGTRRFKAEADGETRWFDWHQLFERQGNTFDWRDDVQDQKWLNDARTHLVEQMQKLVTEIVLSRTYFSFEEAGLGYLCVPRNPFGGDIRAFESACAFVRVFGDAYRLLDSPYDRTPDPWKDENAVGTTNKVIRFATALWGPDARKNLRGVLDQLAVGGTPRRAPGDRVVACSTGLA